MARFYARFDSGSESTLDNDYFDRRRIGAGSASAALLRDGLISSRSALSTDIYADLDGVNKDASRGTYFPPDSGPFSTDGSTFVSWSTAYTSSVDGIKFPVTNSYGSATVINYSKRPTASIVSTMTQLVTASAPADPVGASYTTYINATNAVNTVLTAIQDGAAVSSTPYSRPGNTPSRTVHSIWHDPNLQYFAWDDFTPGTPGQNTPTNQGNGTCQGSPNFYTQPTLRVYYAKQFANDFNPNTKIDVSIRYTSNNGGSTQFDGFTGFDISGSGTSGNYRYIEYVSSVLSEGTGFGDDIIDYNMEVTMSFLDPLITSSRGTYSYIGPVGIINCACASNGATCA